MKRAGLLGSDSGDNPNGYIQPKSTSTLQSTKQQQASTYYKPQLTNYVAPKRQPETSQTKQLQTGTELDKRQSIQQRLQQIQLQQQQLQQLQQQQQQLRQQQQNLQSSLPTSTRNIPLNINPIIKSIPDIEPQQDGTPKTNTKADRQGLYGHDAGNYDTGYSGNHDGYDGYSESHSGGGYSGGGHYSPEPVYKPVYKPSVAINIDPVGILKLLLSGIPKPLLNLNGKLFFGVELGKNAGLVTGFVHPPPKKPHYGGGVLTYG